MTESISRGVYYVNNSGEMTPLLTVDGGGDRPLLEEVLEEHGYILERA